MSSFAKFFGCVNGTQVIDAPDGTYTYVGSGDMYYLRSGFTGLTRWGYAISLPVKTGNEFVFSELVPGSYTLYKQSSQYPLPNDNKLFQVIINE